MVISGPKNLVEEGIRSEEDVNLKEALDRLSDLVVLESKRMISLEAKVDSIASMLQTVLDHIEDYNKASSASGKVRDQMDDLQRFTYDDLKKFTDNFSDQNFIGRTQFCKVYRGKILEGCNGTAEENVTVKIWADKLQMNRELINESVCADNINRFRDELSFLKNHRHPNLAKLKGSCYEDGKMGVVYELNSFDNLRDLIAEGSIKWIDRIRILIQFARLMLWLHDVGPRYLVRNISAAHIMIDQDLKPILFEFGLLARCGSADEMKIDRCFYPWGAFGYIDPAIAVYDVWSFRVDVFAYGILIIELLCRRQVDEFYNNVEERFYLMSTYANRVNKAAKSNPHISLSSIVSKKFAKEAEYDKEDAAALMELAVKCASEPESWYQRPTMLQIVHKLKSLHVVQNHLNEISLWVIL